MDYHWTMNHIQIQSVAEGFDRQGVLQRLLTLMARVSAMGLLPEGQRIERLDDKAFRLVLKSLQACNLISGRSPVLAYITASSRPAVSAREQILALDGLLRVVEESPVPEKEWAAMRDIFGDEELTRLLGISLSSVKRYAVSDRETPMNIAVRLHWLAMIVADLAGSYNELGIRRWFHRPRGQLEGKSPLQTLGKNWDTDSVQARHVRDLASSLAGAGAT